jgi:hypothetical protein
MYGKIEHIEKYSDIKEMITMHDLTNRMKRSKKISFKKTVFVWK